jgi:hypothetical protein
MLFRQRFDPSPSTFTCLLACERTREAVLIGKLEPSSRAEHR